jgi:hypothetical protein
MKDTGCYLIKHSIAKIMQHRMKKTDHLKCLGGGSIILKGMGVEWINLIQDRNNWWML